MKNTQTRLQTSLPLLYDLLLAKSIAEIQGDCLAALADGACVECPTLKLIADCGCKGKSANVARDFTMRLHKHLGVDVAISPLVVPQIDYSTGLLNNTIAGLLAPQDVFSAL